MTTMPRFRRMIRAIGDHEKPKETAYRYEIVEFWPNGEYINRPNVLIDKETQMRADDDRIYEMEDGMGGWVLISQAEFLTYKAQWDSIRISLGYSMIDDMGLTA